MNLPERRESKLPFPFACGWLSRTVTLPATARTDDVKAVHKDGVSVGLAEEKEEGRRITVER
ncbi:hypothetical protein ACQEUU_24960 [Nonomuraea sp. CA-218870]|uniref:hypothetical protein n=1 Tax=Nonomuraea sp. CA-218870 TaxID=3239998 RepID=UPI003D8CC364